MAGSQTKLPWDVLLDLKPDAGGPLHERLTAALRSAINRRELAVGDLLPPSRTLARELGCSRWAVTEAFGQLVAEGYLEARTGAGTRVRWAAGESAPDHPTEATRREPAPRFDLTPGLPDLRAFPRRHWAAAIATQSESVAFTEFGYPDPNGHPRLRELLATYLRRARHVDAKADDVTICTSVTDGVRRLCQVLQDDGITAIGCEEPGWTRLRTVIQQTGMQTVPIATDTDGMRTDELAAHPELRAVLVTPAHQFPRGTVLSPQRRAALLGWARSVDGLVVEDDYDAEFRYDRRPVATLQGMDPSRVALVKSVSKTLSPALGIGWMVTPHRWTTRLRAAPGTPALPPLLDQLALADLVEHGIYDRHLRQLRLRYRARRDVLVDELGRLFPGYAVSGIAAGLHLVLDLPDAVDSAAVVRAAAAASLRLVDLRAYHHDARHAANGLVLGYGNITDSAAVEAARLLHDVLRY
ncbi:PLP-dependent aminotransferase family protein [Pseudonocardia sp. CA-107938]|uniref:MocR-like pyridoxine biosynthesis transcription factor PdxR n=1 Tax=Pseudonocardia sp. CA-107938 TaxID=3240021 RepID=UPI003D8F6CD2